MIYIFVGEDGSGKTTLATKFAEKNGFEYKKFNNKPTNKDVLATEALLEVGNKSEVWDRFYYPDNLIYNHVLNKPNEEVWLSVINLLSRTDVTWVYVTADNYTLSKRLDDRGDDYIVDSNLRDISKEYSRWIKEAKTFFPNHLFITIDTTFDDYRVLL